MRLLFYRLRNTTDLFLFHNTVSFDEQVCLCFLMFFFVFTTQISVQKNTTVFKLLFLFVRVYSLPGWFTAVVVVLCVRPHLLLVAVLADSCNQWLPRYHGNVNTVSGWGSV